MICWTGLRKYRVGRGPLRQPTSTVALESAHLCFDELGVSHDQVFLGPWQSVLREHPTWGQEPLSRHKVPRQGGTPAKEALPAPRPKTGRGVDEGQTGGQMGKERRERTTVTSQPEDTWPTTGTSFSALSL